MGELGAEAVALVRQNYLTSPALDQLLPDLSILCTEAAEDTLQAALEKSPHQTVRGRAAYWLAKCLQRRAEDALLLPQMPDPLKQLPLEIQQIYQPAAQYRLRLRNTDPAATSRRAEALYERLGKEFAQVKLNDDSPRTLGEHAQHALFALRNLAVGRTAPDIEGPDLDGKNLKLSDYRGKVVVLFFCGHWEGSFREMNPHKQSLVKRYADRPFALLDVNSDEDPDDCKEVMKKEGYTWRCWADGGPEGRISRTWNVDHWPTIYVLDAKGVIRYKELRDEPLQKAVDALLAEQEGGHR